jgi:uncharacterized delta-60 repeat protein
MSGSRLRKWVAAASGLVAATAIALPAGGATSIGAEGSGDGAFATHGLDLDWQSGLGGAVDAALQPDGKIVVALGDPVTGYGWRIARYTTTGALDPTFGVGGIAHPSVGSSADRSLAVAVAPDGKIVSAGWADNGSGQDLAVVRMSSSGSLDPTFSGDGKQVTFIAPNADQANDVLVQPDGKVVVGGFSTTANSDQLVVRYTATGGLDGGFASGGIQNINASTLEGVNSIALQSDGKIVTAGYAKNDAGDGNIAMSVLRLLPDGSLETSATFAGNGGPFDVSFGNDLAYTVAIQRNGGIIVGGYVTWANIDAAAMRLRPDGTLDTSWGVGATPGVTNLDRGVSAAEYFRAAAIARDGKIVLVGDVYSDANHGREAFIVRLGTGGALD